MPMEITNNYSQNYVNQTKTQENNSFENVTDKKVMTCTAQGSNKVLLFSDALMSYASPKTGESVNIYRADNYSKENPIYVIMGLDANGNEFKKEIDAGKINPNHCSYNELMVLNTETGHTSNRDWLHALAIRDKANPNSYFEEKDYMAYAQAVIKDYQRLGSWDSYLSMNKWLQSIIDYTAVKTTSDNRLIANGDTEQTFSIGAQSFTLKEWDEFLEKFDAAEEEIQKMQKEEIEKRTGRNIDMPADYAVEETDVLTSEYTMCSYPAGNPEEEEIRYITYYTSEGIFCRKVGQKEGYEWKIPFENKEQYDKVMDFINQFPTGYNFRFAAHENFWRDYLNGTFDEEAFLYFMEGTNNGVPDYSIVKDDSVYIDKDKIQWAKYLNPLGSKFYTAEEFQEYINQQIQANQNKKQVLKRGKLV